jgi:hypothetical protein
MTPTRRAFDLHSHLTLCGLIVLSLALTRVSVGQTPSVMPPNLDAITVANLLSEGKFQQIEDHLSPLIQLSTSQMKNGWDAYVALTGPIKKTYALDVNVARAIGPLGAIVVTTNYDASGAITALWINHVSLSSQDQAILNPWNDLSPVSIAGFGLTTLLIFFLIVAFFRSKVLDAGQWAIMRLLGALCAAFAAAFFTGDALFKLTKSLGGTELSISGAAGFALFFTVWFFFPKKTAAQ